MAASRAAATSTAMRLQSFQNAAGHGGVMQDEAGEIVVKPCTQAEIDFYQETSTSHADFATFMPICMGTLALGDHAAAVTMAQAGSAAQALKTIKTEVAIVLENIEYGYKHPNVVDLKLGSRLYAPDTEPSKAARLDKVASETTSGSLSFRVAGMKLWNEDSSSYNLYDKQYGRQFSADRVHEAFDAFFATLKKAKQAKQLLKHILDDLVEVRNILESAESRFYSSSVLLVYEGDVDELNRLCEHEPAEETSQVGEDGEDGEAEDPVPPFRLKMIDFAHSTWQSSEGPDENVIKGLRSIEQEIRKLIDEQKPG